jgi:hypothetical protein
MRNPKVLIILSITGLLLTTGCNSDENDQVINTRKILKVPADFPTIASAYSYSKEGDWIIISPGKYSEHDIEINKSITISSEWKLTEDETKIDKTIIDPGDNILFSIITNGVEISGLHIINGNHTLSMSANVTVLHNHFDNNLDALSFETGSGGRAAYNLIENDRDDGIDSDIGEDKKNIGSDIVIEHNTISNSSDDGIEIRLFSYPNQYITYTIAENTIVGSKNAGIQLISYDVYTGKVFHIHHNIIGKCKTGLGCMGGSNTDEDLSGAPKMDEYVYFYNNTIIGNKMGATGGNKIIALNNIVKGNDLGGFKRFGKNSAVLNNLFYQNGIGDYIELNDAIVKSVNILSMDPLLDNTTLSPGKNSPCINAGKDKYELDGIAILKIDPKYIVGTAPDIGAIEYNGVK